jgi:TatD DNase family protein
VINKRNILPELAGLLDGVSVSLNATDPGQYGRLMRLDGPFFFNAMLDFTREAVRHIGHVLLTVVDLEDVDQEKARRIAADLGAEFHSRPYF